MNKNPNTSKVTQLAVEKSENARKRTLEAIQLLQEQGKSISFATVSRQAKVSKTFLYAPRHADLAEKINYLRIQPAKQRPATPIIKGKSDSAKDAQIVHLKERVSDLEKKIRMLQQENELLYGRLADR